MKFSILIANYNNGKFFQDCYKSILQQTYQNWEVVILDDASTDNSVEVIKIPIWEPYDLFFKVARFFGGHTGKPTDLISTGTSVPA